MPANEFKCPDGVNTPIEDCMKACRLGSRCASRSYLRKAASQRPWNGTPSATQLENGPRMEWLRIKNYFAIDPREDMAFAILGTTAHDHLATVDDDSLTEQRLINQIASGQFDNYYIENGKGILTDHKTYGAYAVKKFMEGKSQKEVRQLNFYRLLLQQHGHQVDEMYLEVIVRDGGTYVAKNMGVDKRFYHLPVPFMDDDACRAWFQNKKDELCNALVEGFVPRLCNAEESWEGRRCKEYCQVAEFCKALGDNTWLKEKPKKGDK